MDRTKTDLIGAVAVRMAVPTGRAEAPVSRVFECMTEALQRGEVIEIRGFGSFSVRSYRAYLGRNPRNGDPVEVKAKRLPFFKIGKDLRERINAPTTGPSHPSVLRRGG
jgi:integration host factor subunit beta